MLDRDTLDRYWGDLTLAGGVEPDNDVIRFRQAATTLYIHLRREEMSQALAAHKQCAAIDIPEEITRMLRDIYNIFLAPHYYADMDGDDY